MIKPQPRSMLKKMVNSPQQQSVRSFSVSMPPHAYTPAKYTGPSYEDMLAMRKQYHSPAAFLLYREPVMITDASMQYMYDHTGKRYLDMWAGICTVSVGHGHPRVTAAMDAQMKKVAHLTTVYMNDQHTLYGKELAEKLPDGIDCVYFCSSGSEANAMASQFANLYTGNFSILNLKNCYHGHGGTKHLSNLPTWNHDIPFTQGVAPTTFCDMFRGPHANDPDATTKMADEVKSAIDFSTPGKVGLFMVEPIQGGGGINPTTPGFMQKAIPHVKAAGGLILSDEVQTGFGRTGEHYWGCDMLGFQPDIVTMAKGIGNGFPVAAMATTKEIASVMTKVTFSTYGGNPVGMAAGREVIKVIDDEGMQENARVLGDRLWKGLKELQSRYEQVGDVRGKGLMVGVELVTDMESKTGDGELFGEVMERCKNHGLLFGKGGRFGNVIRLQPPMCLTAADIDFCVDVIDRSLKESLEALGRK